MLFYLIDDGGGKNLTENAAKGIEAGAAFHDVIEFVGYRQLLFAGKPYKNSGGLIAKNARRQLAPHLPHIKLSFGHAVTEVNFCQPMNHGIEGVQDKLLTALLQKIKNIRVQKILKYLGETVQGIYFHRGICHLGLIKAGERLLVAGAGTFRGAEKYVGKLYIVALGLQFNVPDKIHFTAPSHQLTDAGIFGKEMLYPGHEKTH